MKPPADQPHENWETILDRRLRELPNRPAPASLAPRVLAAIQARARLPWYRRPWMQWPRGLQAGSLLLVSFVLGALTFASLHFGELGVPDALSGRVNVWLAPVEALWLAGTTLLELALRLAHQINPWIWAGLGLLATGMYATCVGLGTVLYRVMVKR